MIENLMHNWQANCSINLDLLEAVPEETLGLSAGKGARAVGEILMHMANVRNQWLKAITPDLIKGHGRPAKLDKKTGPSKKDIRAAIEQTAAAVKLLIQQTGDSAGTIKAFKPDLMAFIFYLIAHDAHHRGQVLLTLRLCGHRLNRQLAYGIWDWSKHMLE
jgi:uncharacterized damage-inducible protein DinB